MLYYVLILLLGMAVGAALLFFFMTRRLSENDRLLALSHSENEHLGSRAATLETELQAARSELQAKREESAALHNEVRNLNEKISVQKEDAELLQKRLTVEFENIANKILKERSDEFSQTNEKRIGEILNPLREKIADFEKQVSESYDKEMRDKADLRAEVRKLAELNTKVSEEANSLTRALKGDVKKQGNWGEIILERVLEMSGLHEGREFEREVVNADENGKVYRPDVIVRLPDNKQIIIDSKVSLVAYERLVSAVDAVEKESALKEHLSSLKKHVQELAEKNYQNLLGFNSPDFVLMFVPIEASFSVAVEADQNLFNYAWEKKIVIVSPTTLLATLRTIASIWKQENQTKNAFEIARLSGTLYDKLVGFMDDMQRIRRAIDGAGKAYDDAYNKLSDGKGNLITTAEKIKELGAKANKKIDKS